MNAVFELIFSIRVSNGGWLVAQCAWRTLSRVCIFAQFLMWYVHTAVKRVPAPKRGRRQMRKQQPLYADPVPFPASRRCAARCQVNQNPNTLLHANILLQCSSKKILQPKPQTYFAYFPSFLAWFSSSAESIPLSLADVKVMECLCNSTKNS